MTGSIPPNTASNFQDSKNIKKSTISVAVHTHIRIALIQKLSQLELSLIFVFMIVLFIVLFDLY